MGATGALTHAFRNPDLFRVVGSHSAALPYEGERDFLGTGEDFAIRSPAKLVETADRLNELQIWIDVGDEDDWADRTRLLHEALERRDIDHIWDLSPGGDHWGSYWSARIPDYLRFYDSAFHRERRL
jgi:S-formylglutathione hydrolase FrmB